MTQTCSLKQAAATLGIHRNTLSDWLTKGCPAVTRADRLRGVDWELSIPAIFAWREEYAVQEALSSQGEAGHVSKEEADRRRAVAMAITAEVEADSVLRSVILVADAEASMLDFCQALKSGLDNASTRVAGRATTVTNPQEIRDLCHSEFNRAFASAKAELTRQWKDVTGERPPEPDEAADGG